MMTPLERWMPRVARDRSGVAQLASLLVLALVGVLAAFAMSGALSSVRTSGIDYHEARTMYAAEAGAELALAQIKVALRDGYLSDQEIQDIQPPDLEGFSYDSFTIVTVGEPVVETITDGPYVGLYAITENVDIHSRVTDPSGNVSGVVLGAKAQAIPIFQFGVFFEQDLEATNGPPMEFAGRVHSNGNIYLSSNNAWYREIITTPNKVFHDRKDHHNVYNGVYINDAEGNEVQLTFDSRSMPSPDQFKQQSCVHFDCRLMTDAFNTDSLELPLPEGVAINDVVLPRDETDSDAQKDVKFAWNADLYLTVDLVNLSTNAAVCGGGGDPTPWPTLTIERPAGKVVPGAAETCAIFQWRWSDYYDGREDELKDVLNVDIAQLAAWVGADDTRRSELIYVNFVVPPDLVGFAQSVLDQMPDAGLEPAVRVVNGGTLPNRLTVATEWPIYVRGNYNNVNKVPSALVGDGITILSTAWSDGQNRPGAAVFNDCVDVVSVGDPCADYVTWSNNWSKRDAAETTVNGAIMAGHWATPCDHEDAGCDGGYTDFYGGGIENFPRFLERWSGIQFHYTGSLISPFASQKTTGTWNGGYYSPPQRDWAFDLDFRNPALLPPGTPNVGVVIRTAFREEF